MAEAETIFPAADRHNMELRAVAELERLPGVLTAAVWLTPEGRLRDARIHASPGTASVIICNAAGRVFEALTIPFDSGDIRVSHLAIAADIEAVVPAPAARFLLLQDITMSRAGAHITCRVQLLHGQETTTGEARELDTSTGRARAAANATLRAAETVSEDLALGVEGVCVSSMFGRSYAIVSVEASVGRRCATLSGIASVDGSRGTEEAVCLATLRAIDRWVALC
jgi:hypothetical protein